MALCDGKGDPDSPSSIQLLRIGDNDNFYPLANRIALKTLQFTEYLPYLRNVRYTPWEERGRRLSSACYCARELTIVSRIRVMLILGSMNIL